MANGASVSRAGGAILQSHRRTHARGSPAVARGNGAPCPDPILLFSGPFADLPFDTLDGEGGRVGLSGVRTVLLGRPFRSAARAERRQLLPRPGWTSLARNDLHAPVVAAHKVGQAVSDPIDERHQALLPDYVWGDGKPAKVQQRAAEEMMATFRLAEKLGAGVVSGFTGSPIWSWVSGYPGPKPGAIAEAREAVRQTVEPDPGTWPATAGCGSRAEIHPGQLAFDLYSAELALDALDGREEFGFTFDPSHLHWQGVEPVEFLRRFPDRIFHVHVKDAIADAERPDGGAERVLAERRPEAGVAVPQPRPRRDRLGRGAAGRSTTSGTTAR